MYFIFKSISLSFQISREQFEILVIRHEGRNSSINTTALEVQNKEENLNLQERKRETETTVSTVF